jgi:hypothetical protein
MPRITFKDLAAFGLLLVTPKDPAFLRLSEEILNRTPLFPSRALLPQAPIDDASAVLLNQSGKAVITLTYFWKYTLAGGHVRTHQRSDLGSSRQMDVLSGRASPTRDPVSFILPGSKRLITKDGIFGDNRDVLPPDTERFSGGIGSAGGARDADGEDVEHIELQLDAAIFEDGLCAGPNESGLFDSVTEALNLERNTARQIVEILRSGGSLGQAFEILRPLAKRPEVHYAHRRTEHHAGHLLGMFSNVAINRLINLEGEDLIGWFEESANIRSLTRAAE